MVRNLQIQMNSLKFSNRDKNDYLLIPEPRSITKRKGKIVKSLSQSNQE